QRLNAGDKTKTTLQFVGFDRKEHASHRCKGRPTQMHGPAPSRTSSGRLPSRRPGTFLAHGVERGGSSVSRIYLAKVPALVDVFGLALGRHAHSRVDARAVPTSDRRGWGRSSPARRARRRGENDVVGRE